MKKLLFLSLVLTACCVFFVSQRQFTSVHAQKNGISSKAAAGQNENDRQLAKSIKKLTDRSAEGLKEEYTADGGVEVDIHGRFQNVMLSKIDTDGEPTAACVTSLDEANSFFGKNLETGESLAAYEYQKDFSESLAARHGMSENEFEFYKKLIDDAARLRAANPEAAGIAIVNNDGAGEGFNDATAKSTEGGNPGTTLGQQRLNLFNYAAGIWGAFLDTKVPINVSAQFNPLTPCSTSGGVLGSAGAYSIYRDFTNAEFSGTWYHAALANKRAGVDLSGNPEIEATFNSDVDSGCLGSGRRFYYGFDNSTPSGTVNLLIVVLHEMGHGLGFSSFVNGSTGALYSGLPDVYTRFMYDKSVNKYWYQMTDAERKVSALNAGNVYWDGPNVKAASSYLINGVDSSGRVELFTPNPYQSGSSISHFSTSAYQNLLMEPVINTGLPLTLDLTRQQMRDIGWYMDKDWDGIPDSITGVQPSSNPVIRNSQATVMWTNTGGFGDNVTVELSLDGGANYSVLASNVSNTGSYTFNVPDVSSTNAKVRVRQQDFMYPNAESSSFNILLAPTAASATVSGKVVNNKNLAISRAAVSLIDMNGNQRTARTNEFGNFRFENVAVGETYVLSATAKGHVFKSKPVTINADLTELSIEAINKRQ